MLLVFLKVMAGFSGSGSIEYLHGSKGEVLGATGAFSMWQQTILWAYPIALFAIAIGIFWLASSVTTFDKPLTSDALNSRAL